MSPEWAEKHKTLSFALSKQKLAPMVVNIDPVCGMTVAEDSAHVYEHQSVSLFVLLLRLFKEIFGQSRGLLNIKKERPVFFVAVNPKQI